MATSHQEIEHDIKSDGRDAPVQPAVVLPDDGEAFGFADTGGHWKIDAADTGERFGLTFPEL